MSAKSPKFAIEDEKMEGMVSPQHIVFEIKKSSIDLVSPDQSPESKMLSRSANNESVCLNAKNTVRSLLSDTIDRSPNQNMPHLEEPKGVSDKVTKF